MLKNMSSNEFSLSKAQASTENKAECKVVINNGSNCQYPPNPYVTERSVSVEDDNAIVNDGEFNPSMEFYKHLSKVLSEMMRDNTPKMIANLIDDSGKIIVGAADLVVLISSITNKDANSVSIIYDNHKEQGCFAKVNPIKKVRNIKVGGVDFQLCFNKEYNILADEFVKLK